jgi:hypothetical protein
MRMCRTVINNSPSCLLGRCHQLLQLLAERVHQSQVQRTEVGEEGRVDEGVISAEVQVRAGWRGTLEIGVLHTHKLQQICRKSILSAG